MPTFLAEAESVISGFDVDGVFDIIVSVVNKVVPLFLSFPFNIFLGSSLVGIGVGLFRKLKKS